MKSGYLPQLDGVRFIAIAMVLSGHLYMADLTIFLSQSGVNLFFVLSGFLITNVLYQNQSLLRFYARRILRIWPLYVLSVVLAYFFNIPNARGCIGYLMTFTINIPVSNYSIDPQYLTHLWSLSVEEQFYFIYPFLFVLLKGKRRKFIFLGMILAGVGSRLGIGALLHYPRTISRASYTFTLACFDAFGIGCFLSYLFKEKVTFLNKYLDFRLAFLVIFGLSMFLNFYGNNIFPRLLFSTFSAWLIANAAFGRWPILENPLIVYIGRISYGIYVFDRIVSFYLRNVPHGVWLQVPITICVATVSWFCLERPFLKLKRFFP